MIRRSHGPRLLVNNNNFTNMCCKTPQVPTAHNLFDTMPFRCIVTWNSLMGGYTQLGIGDQALDVFRKPSDDNVGLGRFSYAGALSVCGQTGDLMNGKIVHGLAVVGGFARRVFLVNSLIDMYSQCGKIDEVRLVFDYADEVDDVSWNFLFSAYVRVGWPEVAMNILVWMHRSGVKLNSFALGAVLNAGAVSDDSREVQMLLHGFVTKVGLDLDFLVGNAMLDIYAKSDGLDEAIKVFESMPNRSLIVHNAMVAGLSLLGTKASTEVRIEALKLFSGMLRRRMMPSKFTFKSVIEACSFTCEFEFGKQVHAQVIKNSLGKDEFICNRLVTMYANSDYMEESLKCFHCTGKQDMVTWRSMIQGYVRNGQLDRAMGLFREILCLGRKPDHVATSNLMSGSGSFGMVRSGEQIQCYAVKAGLDQFADCGNSQMILYTKSGDMDAAIKTFQESAAIDVVSWSLLILSYALHGFSRDALIFFEKMEEHRLLPNNSTFLAVLTACRFGGLVDEGFRYLQIMMTEYGLTPNSEHYACIVDILGQYGRLDEAEKFISQPGFINDKILWQALLSSCQFHSDTKRCIHVGEKLMELDPFTSTSYIPLYNLYLDIGDFSLAMRTRGRMRERGVKKEAGVSWIEIAATAHSFVAGDYSHPQSGAIFVKLEEMLFKLKKKSCADVKILELEYRSKKWKESLFSSHGEQLAVALGTICLPESIPIRVMNSSKICGNCHVILKLLSESERREIVLRDPIRFHHFNLGSCSCGDYW